MRTFVAGLTLVSLVSVALTSGCASAPRGAAKEAHVAAAPSCAEVQGGADVSVREAFSNVESVETLREGGTAKFPPHPAGAIVHVGATRGMTAQWLSRAIACHVASDDVTPCSDAGCPLALARIRSEVTPTGTGFDVVLRPRDPADARELELRARALVTSRAPGPAKLATRAP